MRMWGIDPKLMCTRHLLGEHCEMHMFAGSLDLGRSVAGFIEKGLVALSRLKTRHDVLATEIEQRGYRHSSPLKTKKTWPKAGKIEVEANLIELARRCPECRERQTDEGIERA